MGAIGTWLLALIPATLSLGGQFMAALVGAFGTFMAWMTAKVGSELAIRLTVLAIYLTMLAGILSALETIMNSVGVVAPTYWGPVQSYIIPDNFAVCVSAILSVKITVWFWELKNVVIGLVSGAATD